jgi:hypothetical protein
MPRFQEVFCLTEKIRTDEAQGLMLAEAPGSEACNVGDDPVSTSRGIEIHSQKGTTAGTTSYPLQLYQESGSHSIPTREATKLARMQQQIIDATMSQGSPLDA